MRFKGIILFTGILWIILTPLQADSLGLLKGKNYYLPFIPYLSFSGTDPDFNNKGLQLEHRLYWINEIMGSEMPPLGFSPTSEIPSNNIYLQFDYESLIMEEVLSYDRGDAGRWLLTLRGLSYFDGIADPFIEEFHQLFGFPNAGRENFPQNDLFIFFTGTSGYDGITTSPILALGDIDLEYQRPLLSRGNWRFQGAGALKIPSFQTPGLIASSHPDIGIQLSASYLGKKINAHLQSALVIPLAMFTERSPHISSQNILALEFRAAKDLSILAQFHLNSSFIDSPYTRELGNLEVNMFAIPQTNLRLGLKARLLRGLLQFYVEEDPGTYEGADILLNISFTHQL